MLSSLLPTLQSFIDSSQECRKSQNSQPISSGSCSIWVVPISIPLTSSLANVLGKAFAAKPWLAASPVDELSYADATEGDKQGDVEKQRRKVLAEMHSAIGRGQPEGANAVFFACKEGSQNASLTSSETSSKPWVYQRTLRPSPAKEGKEGKEVLDWRRRRRMLGPCQEQAGVTGEYQLEPGGSEHYDVECVINERCTCYEREYPNSDTLGQLVYIWISSTVLYIEGFLPCAVQDPVLNTSNPLPCWAKRSGTQVLQRCEEEEGPGFKLEHTKLIVGSVLP
ncbi:hypothetical protein BDP27DRAFT_1373948 [Rhodocollybia butyracea]|uniref:Uncharacterized protein n=1 Tax=Rhodocollybia butyracea TaxID=206335 RepID=A0A9P5P863_9AGAR|nr:hypothetical protein BDP27DRAFT_1373948 [Rhodocollybia butyracea]